MKKISLQPRHAAKTFILKIGPALHHYGSRRGRGDTANHRKERNQQRKRFVLYGYSLRGLSFCSFELTFIYLFYLVFAAASSINSATSHG